MNAERTALEATDPFTPGARHVAVVSAGLSDASSTTLLARRLADATAAELSTKGIVTEVHVIELRPLATAIAEAVVSNNPAGALKDALREVEQADAIITASPVFRASYSGLFKSFWDLVDETAIAGLPVLLGATGGTPRHSLVIDHAMRPLFAYFKSLLVPTAVFAAADDWGDVDDQQDSRRDAPLESRIAAAGRDLGRIVATLPARVRTAPDELPEVDVVPFKSLLRGLGA